MLYEVRKDGLDDGLGTTSAELRRFGIPQFARIEIPMDDPEDYLRVAALLDNLANVFRLNGRLRSEPERRRVIDTYWETRTAADKIRWPDGKLSSLARQNRKAGRGSDDQESR